MVTYQTTVEVTNQVLVKTPLSLAERRPVYPWWLSTLPRHHGSVLLNTGKDSMLVRDFPKWNLVLGKERTSP